MSNAAAGTKIDGRYELIARVPDRGLGEAWSALDANFKNRRVLLKLLRPVVVTPGDDELPEGLREHFKSVRAFRHPGALATLNQGLWGGRPFVVQELFEGRSLGSGLDGARETGTLLPAALLEGLFARVAAVVAAAHARPEALVHGDLNPGCVMVQRSPGADFDVRLMDFGLARFADPDPTAPDRSARALRSSAPEQYDPSRPWTPLIDVFALGHLLREMLASPPDVGETLSPAAMHRRRDDIPESVWEASLRASATEPSQRYPDVESFVAEVQRAWKQPVAPKVRPPSPEAPPAPRAQPPEMYAEALPEAVPEMSPAPRYELPSLPRAPSAALSVADYASTLYIAEMPPDSNPWDVPALPTEAPRGPTTMDELLRQVSERAAARPAASAGRTVSVEATMALDAEEDLSRTAVDSPRDDDVGSTMVRAGPVGTPMGYVPPRQAYAMPPITIPAEPTRGAGTPRSPWVIVGAVVLIALALVGLVAVIIALG